LDDNDEDELAGIKNNNPPVHAELPVDDQVDDSTAGTMFLPLVKTDEDDFDDDASSTALGLTADESDATTASATALDHLVDGSNAPPASTTALGLPADGSNLPEEGDVMDAGSDGNEVGPAGNGTTATPSIPPMRQSTLFPIFRRGFARIGQLPATTPRYETRQAFPRGLEGEWGQLHGRTVPRLLGMHRSQGTPLHPRAACQLRSLVPQRVPQSAQGGWSWANPQPLCLQQRPRMLKHDRAACRPWPLVWERAPWLAKRGRLHGRVLLLQHWLHRRRLPFTMIWALKRQAGTLRELPSMPPLPCLCAQSTRLRKRRQRLLRPEVVQWSAGMAAPVDPVVSHTFGRLFRLQSSR